MTPDPLDPMLPFVAIDFETADYQPDSACAVGLVRVEWNRIVARQAVLIRPPRQVVRNTWVHGITWALLEPHPIFADVWPTLTPMLEGAAFLAAHNSPFDEGVLARCCEVARLPMPSPRFICTVALARKIWKQGSNKLPDVCNFLGLPLKHHDAASDAEACARIVLAARDATKKKRSTRKPRPAYRQETSLFDGE